MHSDRKLAGFTLIELMIVVAIIAILAAIAIPAYQSYIRRSYLSEATSSIAAIKSAEESYFTINGCYIEAGAWPATIPAGNQLAWGAPTATPPTLAWGQTGLAVRPDRNVRFQYQVYATNSLSATDNCAAPGILEATIEGTTDTTGIGSCITNAVGAADSFVSTTFFPTDWYIVVARGDLDGDLASGGQNSLIISAIDDSTIVMCNELE